MKKGVKQYGLVSVIALAIIALAIIIQNASAENKAQIEIDAERYIEEINPYYFYNKSISYNDHITVEQLKRTGGTCGHYSRYFVERASEDGYFAEAVRVRFAEDRLHEYAQISGEEGYCILDIRPDGAFIIGCKT